VVVPIRRPEIIKRGIQTLIRWIREARERRRTCPAVIVAARECFVRQFPQDKIVCVSIVDEDSDSSVVAIYSKGYHMPPAGLFPVQMPPYLSVTFYRHIPPPIRFFRVRLADLSVSLLADYWPRHWRVPLMM